MDSLEFRPLSSLLILSQGGFIPDIVLWLSYFYTSRELPIRLRYDQDGPGHLASADTLLASFGLHFL